MISCHRPGKKTWWVICFCLVIPAGAHADVGKKDRVVGLYELTLRFQDATTNWDPVSDAFIKQLQVDVGSNCCINLMNLPMHFTFESGPGDLRGQDTSGQDYVIGGDVSKDAKGYRIDSYLLRGADRLVVRSYTGLPFADLKDAAWNAQMAALNLRWVGSGTKPLADIIWDFEKQQRQDSPQDHAIAPKLTVNLSDADRYPLTLDLREKREISFTLIDCDDVLLKGAEVKVETITGKVSPEVVNVDDQGAGKFTYTAPDHEAKGTIRVGFSYLRGSQHQGPPEYDIIDLRIQEPPKLCFSVAVDLKMQMPSTPATFENHHIETIYRRAGLDPDKGCGFAAMKTGEGWGLVEASIKGTATGHRETGMSKSSSVDRAGELMNASAKFTREAEGGTFTFVIRGVPAGDAEEYVGNCAAQRWQPWPPQFKLSEDDLRHTDKLRKTLSLNLPLGENDCVGTGTAVLTGHP